MSILYLIPARKGSKGLPNKNNLNFDGKTLVEIALNHAASCSKSDDIICLSTNDDEVIFKAKENGVNVYFKRPDSISGDKTVMEDVIFHALSYFEKNGKYFDLVILLQPTSPLRQAKDILNVIELYDGSQEMIVTVYRARENPYFNLYKKTENGILEKFIKNDFEIRQQTPELYVLNGAVYLYNVRALKVKGIKGLLPSGMIKMPFSRSIDIDSQEDWDLATHFKNLKHEID